MSNIIRVKKQKGYSVISNNSIADKRLSWEAAGLLAYLLTKPDDWSVNNSHLYSYRSAGEHKVKRMLRELKDAGYLDRYKVAGKGGRFEWVSDIYENPKDNPTIGRLSTDGSATDGSATDGKPPHILSTDPPNTDLLSTEAAAAVFSAYENNIGMLSPILSEKIGEAIDEYPHQWLLDAIQEAATHNGRSWAYIEKILKRWKVDGRGPRKAEEPAPNPNGDSGLPSWLPAHEDLPAPSWEF